MPSSNEERESDLLGYVAAGTIDEEDPLTSLPSIVVMPSADYAAAIGSDPNTRSKSYFVSSKHNSGFGKAEYRDLVQICRNIYKDEGIVSRYIDFLLGLSSLGMENSFKRTVKDRHKIVFNAFAGRVNEGFLYKSKGLDEFQRKFCWEFWTSGLIVTLERVDTMALPVGNRRVNYKVPVEIDILDPMRLDLDQLYSKNIVGYELTSQESDDIKKNGVRADFLQIYPDTAKTPDRTRTNTDLAGRNPVLTKADIVEMVRQGEKSIPLPHAKIRMYKRDFSDYGTWPMPFLAGALFALADKSLLRESDRSVMSKIINMILLYKIGAYNAQGHHANVGDKLLTTAMSSFVTNVQRSKDGRVLMQFVPDTHSIDWVTPKTDTILHEDKYRTANIELVSSLIGPAAWQIMSSTARNEDLFFKIAWTQHELFLNVYQRFIEQIYADIVRWNHMAFDPTDVNLKPRRLTVFDTKEYVAMKSNLTQMGWLSVRTALNDAGEDFESEVQNLIEERDLRSEQGILQAIPTFSQTSSKDGGAPEETGSRRSQGRPVGVVETEPRKGSKDSFETDSRESD